MAYKSNGIEMQKRISELVDFMGCEKKPSRESILRFCSKWKVSERTIDKYQKMAIKVITDTYVDKFREGVIKKSIERMEDLYARMYEQGDYEDCLKVVTSQNKILGTIISHIDHTTGGKSLIQPTIVLNREPVEDDEDPNDE